MGSICSNLFDTPLHQSLERLAAQCLASGDFETAYKLADRRCRIEPIADPHSYLLRAEAAYKLGNRQTALADVNEALQIAPDNILANRRRLAWASASERIEAAASLIANDYNFDVLRRAVQTLQRNRQKYIGRVSVFYDAIEGWAVWQANASLKVTIRDGISTVAHYFKPDVSHPLSNCGHATAFRIERSRSSRSESILLSVAGHMFHSVTRPGIGEVVDTRPVFMQTGPRLVTVIVPVYDDYKATRRCLQSLIPELTSQYRAILVDDASPNARIVRMLNELKSQPEIEVLSNKRNLGFIGSVNRALDNVAAGDVILLNADTIVPRGFIDRLATVARSSADIGTVTPLSNNSELTSFPIANVLNSIPSQRKIAQIDAVATRVNAGKVIDIPSGTGFCLYITRTCLNAVGALSTEFHSGYLEDAHFCLRARELGFRSVCNPSVYLGHAGSKSYGSEKRSLVVRNLEVLEKQFPQHRLECAAFMAADPLRAARRDIELAAISLWRRPKLLVTGTEVPAKVARELAYRLNGGAASVLILEVRKSFEGPVIRFFNDMGHMPQSIEFKLSHSKDWKAFTELTKELRPSRIEFIDPGGVPLAVVDHLLEQQIPYDIFIADAGLLGDEQPFLAALGPRSALECAITSQWNGLSANAVQLTGTLWAEHWRKIADHAGKLLVASDEAKAFAKDLFPARRIATLPTSKTTRPVKQLKKPPAKDCLGLIPIRSDAQEQQLINAVIHDLQKVNRDLSLTVVGGLLDDLALMRATNTFVTGPINADELNRAADLHGLTGFFVCTTRPLFEHPILSRISASHLPKAYFDWSAGRSRANKRDLLLDPGLSIASMTKKLDRWIRKH